MTSTDLAAAVCAALRRRGYTILVRPARSCHRGEALAAVCEMSEDDRDWDPHWDQCPYRVIGHLTPQPTHRSQGPTAATDPPRTGIPTRPS
jgi:hypothetical protein